VRKYLKDACEELDAGVFTGDVLFNTEERHEFAAYLTRWMKAVKDHEKEQQEFETARAEEGIDKWQFEMGLAEKTGNQKIYPDTAAGAFQLLRDLSGLDTEGATASPCPSVSGVWRIWFPKGCSAVAYLAGYKDVYGRMRVYNDFETDCEE
jgi:hypothetical protein